VQHRTGDPADEVAGLCRQRREPVAVAGRTQRGRQRAQRGDRGVDRRVVALHDRATAAAVGGLDGRLDRCHRLVGGQHAGEV